MLVRLCHLLESSRMWLGMAGGSARGLGDFGFRGFRGFLGLGATRGIGIPWKPMGLKGGPGPLLGEVGSSSEAPEKL